MSALKLTLACFLLSAAASAVLAQAAAEYAVKSAESAVSKVTDNVHFGVCALNGTFLGCVHRHYPGPFYVAVVAVCFALWMLLHSKRRA